MVLFSLVIYLARLALQLEVPPHPFHPFSLVFIELQLHLCSDITNVLISNNKMKPVVNPPIVFACSFSTEMCNVKYQPTLENNKHYLHMVFRLVIIT